MYNMHFYMLPGQSAVPPSVKQRLTTENRILYICTMRSLEFASHCRNDM